ncbi:MAG: electron transport complex subunit RsxE [Eubacterium sp.]|nr:electron transport complex subunit RsxE [Eubacterium sp.]
MNKCTERLYNGIVKENPTFVQMLGMCPTLAVTSTAMNGLGMGLATTAVLTMSNIMISALRKVIPDKVRIPAFITIIASFVTIISFLMQAYTPDLYESLGVYIALIVVNCIILGRAESYASKNPVIPSLFDGLGMGLGFTVGLTAIGVIREFLGAGAIFGISITKELFDPIAIFSFNPGAFFVLAFIIAGINAHEIRKSKKTGEKPKLRRIDGCSDCTNVTCQGKDVPGEAVVTEEMLETTRKNLLNSQAAKPEQEKKEQPVKPQAEKKEQLSEEDEDQETEVLASTLEEKEQKKTKKEPEVKKENKPKTKKNNKRKGDK